MLQPSPDYLMNRQRGVPRNVIDAPAAEDADDTVGLVESLLHMQGLPARGQPAFRFREAEIVVIQLVPLAAQVRFSGFSRSSQVFGDQGPASAD